MLIRESERLGYCDFQERMRDEDSVIQYRKRCICAEHRQRYLCKQHVKLWDGNSSFSLCVCVWMIVCKQHVRIWDGN